MKTWGTARVEWRESPALWGFLGWLAAVLWPPLPFTWILWPPSAEAGGFQHDWRLVVAIVGAIGVGLAMRAIARERRRDGSPKTRFGVIARFVALGFLYSLAAAAIVAVVSALLGLLSPGDAFRRVGDMKTAFLVGIATLPLALVLGTSYAIWAGFVVSLISFSPRPQSVRPTHYMMEQLQPADAPPPAPEPTPEPPKPSGPQPETDMERHLRPDFD